MRYTITISVEAEQDLSCIYKSIALNDEFIAKRALNAFYQKIIGLEYLPYRNPKLFKKNESIRVTYLYNYFIIYEVNDLKSAVYIYRVVYCAKDIKKMKLK